MLKYEAEKDDGKLTAIIRDSSMGGVEMNIRMDSPAVDGVIVHIGFYTTKEEACQELHELFPDMKWR